MRPNNRTAFQLVWGAVGPLSVLFGGTIVLHTAKSAQHPYYRVFDPQDQRYREARKRPLVDRRPRGRRRTVSH